MSLELIFIVDMLQSQHGVEIVSLPAKKLEACMEIRSELCRERLP